MRRRQSSIAYGVAACIAVTSAFSPVLASGLIPTERVVPSSAMAYVAPGAATQRASLAAVLVSAGVEPTHAQARLEALTDAEINQLTLRFDTAPAGGMWLAPFLLVAMVIGALIGARDSRPGIKTDLFGRPSTVALVP